MLTMAVRLLSRKPDILIINLRKLESTVINLERAFSSQNRKDTKGEERKQTQVVVPGSEPNSSWLNIKAAIFGPLDNRMPLPGDVGVCKDIDMYRDKFEDVDILASNFKPNLENTTLEFKVQKCPELLRKGFFALFPNRRMDSVLTVMTLCQKSKNDMSSWSESVEEEREALIESFIKLAVYVCKGLKISGFWADFIEPTSGLPYYGQYTNTTLFETDEKFSQLGFIIDDLGCCKVICHKTWGPNIFLGTVFTNASTDSTEIQDMIYYMELLHKSN